MAKKKEAKLDTSKVGGIAFFLSFLVVVPLAVFGLVFLCFNLPAAPFDSLVRFALGALGGAAVARFFIRGHTAVFLHEFKHSVVANLAGNKATGWKIRQRTGHFEYEFTEKTAGYNAFISVAPYWLPPLTIATIGIALAGWHHDLATVSLIVGLGWGADTELNIRDIGPHQTDFSGLRGGFGIGLLYVASLNAIVLTLVLTLVCWGAPGFKLLAASAWGALHAVIAPTTPLP